MSRKNFKVATDENNQTTLVKIEKTNVPTGKVITIEEKKKRREEREKQYINFRVAALKRRAKRRGIDEKEIPNLIEKLKKQIAEPSNYTILLMYNRNNAKMVEQAVLNNNLEWKMRGDSFMYIDGDTTVLAKIREIVPADTKIHPYTKKKEAILPAKEPPKKEKKPRNKKERKILLKKRKADKRKINIEANRNRKKRAGKAYAKLKKRIKLLAAKKERKPKITQLNNKKASMSLKKAA